MGAGDYSPLVSEQPAGRIQPTQWQASDGSWVLFLGAELPGREADVEVGDFHGYYQTLDITDVRLLTLAVKMRQSVDAAVVNFRGVVYVAGSAALTLEPAAGETVAYAKRTINMTDIARTPTSVHIEFRLEAVSP